MTRLDWEEALARAVVEPKFRARLLLDPGDTLLDYGLNGAQLERVIGLRAYSLPALAALVRRRLPELSHNFGKPAA